MDNSLLALTFTIFTNEFIPRITFLHTIITILLFTVIAFTSEAGANYCFIVASVTMKTIRSFGIECVATVLSTSTARSVPSTI